VDLPVGQAAIPAAASRSMSAAARISSITVAFNPELARLAQQLRALTGQVGEMVVVDNGSQPPLQELFPRHASEYPQFGAPTLRLVTLPQNEGVARGLNVGVEAARESGAAFVLLLDHDSVPAADMVSHLMAAHERGASRPGAPRVAAMGPRVKDLRDSREYPFVRLGWLRNRHMRCGEGSDEIVECDFLISSGTLVPLDAYAAIGAFEEALFIDSVDREWCFRARDRGFVLEGVCAAQLDHRLGDRRRGVANGFELVVHSPVRLYYMTRNRLLLYQRAYVPLKWKLKDFLRVLAKFAAVMLFVSPRGEYARMTLWAIRDAVARRGGKFSHDPAFKQEAPRD
jgi:rhamnosyltransferase